MSWLSASTGHSASLTSCTVEDKALIGIGAVVSEGALVESGAQVAAGSVVPPGARIPAGEVGISFCTEPVDDAVG